MWNVHMWPSSALDLTPVGVCDGETPLGFVLSHLQERACSISPLDQASN